jgi:hypothetical protein
MMGRQVYLKRDKRVGKRPVADILIARSQCVRADC